MPFTPITAQTIKNQIGLVQEFFLNKLNGNTDQPLVEDEDLPQKQRFPKPRLPPTGKITSPRKRPIKEPGPGKGHPKKKMKLNDGEAKEVGTELAKAGPTVQDGEGEKDTVNKNDADKNEEKKDEDAGPKLDTQKVPDLAKPLTNGVVPSPQKGPSSADAAATSTPAPKAKEKLVNGESEGMISPESLEAT